MLEVLIPCNKSSKVCGVSDCQIIDNQKVQPGKKNGEDETLNLDHHPLLTKLSRPQICRPLIQEQHHVAQTAALEQSLSLTNQWPANNNAFT